MCSWYLLAAVWLGPAPGMEISGPVKRVRLLSGTTHGLLYLKRPAPRTEEPPNGTLD